MKCIGSQGEYSILSTFFLLISFAHAILQVITVEDYNEYCHYVAGIVGLGLSRLMHASGLEGFQPDNLSNSMGLFLQVCIIWIFGCLNLSNCLVTMPNISLLLLGETSACG